MNVKTGVPERTIQRHLKDVREFIDRFALNRRGNNYFTEQEAAAYLEMLRVIDETNSIKQGIRALIEYVERQRVMARIINIVNNRQI